MIYYIVTLQVLLKHVYHTIRSQFALAASYYIILRADPREARVEERPILQYTSTRAFVRMHRRYICWREKQ